MAFFMGIDAGTSGIKAVIMDDKGVIHGSGYSECNLITPRPGWAEQDPKDWWRACKEAVRKAADATGLGKQIAGIGFSGQMQGSACMDKNFEPTGNCLLWLDQRSTAEVAEINKIESVNEYLNVTANRCLNSFWAPKLLWVKKHRPEEFDRTCKVVFTKDYLCYKLTGEIATDVSDASLSFLMDVPKRRWADSQFEKLGIPRSFAPDRLLESIEVVGKVRTDVAEELGIAAGIPVVAGGGDQPAGGVGTGIIKSGIIGVTIGTSGVVFGCLDEPFVDKEDRAMYSMAHSVPGKYAFLGLVLTAGGSYKWLRDNIFAEKKAELAAAGRDVYDYMSGFAQKSAVGSEGLVFLPYLNGDKTPHSDENARGVFFGLSYRHGPGDICRSVMEGVTYSLRDILEIIREFGQDVTEVRANGGGAKSPLWLQIQADIFNARVMTMNIEEGTATGASIMAAVGAGHFASVEEACGVLLKVTGVTEPIPANVAVYEEYYQTYRALYPALQDLYAKQAVIVDKYLK
jgi:xylulokinase